MQRRTYCGMWNGVLHANEALVLLSRERDECENTVTSQDVSWTAGGPV